MSPGPLEPEDVLPLGSAEELARHRDPEWPRYVVALGGLCYMVLIVAALATGSFNLLDPIPLIAVLGFISYQLALRVVRSERDPAMVYFVMAAFAAKMMGTLARALVVANVYGGRSDSTDYVQWGKFLAPSYRSFDFSPKLGGPLTGTGYMRALTGVVFSFTGASDVSGAIFFAFLSFVGLLLLWRAFRRAVPTGNGRRYALLVLFLPSMLYWPSALGKDAFAVFCLGLMSYGVARVVTRSILPGLLLFAAGMAGITPLRPHVALTAFCGVVLAAALAKPRGSNAKTPILRMLVFGALVVLGLFLVSSTQSFFGVSSLNDEAVNQTLSEAEGRTSDAGSSFTPVTMSNPANAPLAIVTVLYRPFPIESGSGVAGLTALEGVFLIGLTWTSRRRLRSTFRLMREQPYVAYSVGITCTFIYAFSAFSNFGILARQRCQVMPFFFVLLCLPVWERRGVASTDEALAERDAPVEGPYASAADSTSPYPAGTDAGPYAHLAPPDPYHLAETAAPAEDDDPYARFADPPSRRRPDG